MPRQPPTFAGARCSVSRYTEHCQRLRGCLAWPMERTCGDAGHEMNLCCQAQFCRSGPATSRMRIELLPYSSKRSRSRHRRTTASCGAPQSRHGDQLAPRLQSCRPPGLTQQMWRLPKLVGHPNTHSVAKIHPNTLSGMFRQHQAALESDRASLQLGTHVREATQAHARSASYRVRRVRRRA